MKYLIWVYVLIPFALHSQAEEAIKAILMEQQEAWNKGDIPAFMEHYWQSAKLEFIGSSGPIYGWEATKERYLKTYPDQEAMGQLTFTIKNINRRSAKVYSVVGKFELARNSDDLSGYFLLVWQKIKGRWLIVSDCTVGS